MDKMRIVRVDVNDEEHPLKTGEMFLDRVTNTLYVGGQMGVGDINFSGIAKLLKIKGTLSRQRVFTLNVGVINPIISVNPILNKNRGREFSLISNNVYAYSNIVGTLRKE